MCMVLIYAAQTVAPMRLSGEILGAVDFHLVCAEPVNEILL